jgi:hypothetical protein
MDAIMVGCRTMTIGTQSGHGAGGVEAPISRAFSTNSRILVGAEMEIVPRYPGSGDFTCRSAKDQATFPPCEWPIATNRPSLSSKPLVRLSSIWAGCHAEPGVVGRDNGEAFQGEGVRSQEVVLKRAVVARCAIYELS